MAYEIIIAPKSSTLQVDTMLFKVRDIFTIQEKSFFIKIVPTITGGSPANEIPSTYASIDECTTVFQDRIQAYLNSVGITWITITKDGNTNKIICSENKWVQVLYHPIWDTYGVYYGGLSPFAKNNYEWSSQMWHIGDITGTPNAASQNNLENTNFGIYNYSRLGYELKDVLLTPFTNEVDGLFEIKFSDDIDKYYELSGDLSASTPVPDTTLFDGGGVGYSGLTRPVYFDRHLVDNNERSYRLYIGSASSYGAISGAVGLGDAMQIIGYYNVTLPTVQKWDVIATSGEDGTYATIETVITPMSQGGSADVAVTLTWSSDGVNYIPINTPLTGLQPNVDYNVYVKDQFNGVRMVPFTTTVEVDVKLVAPYFKIENANSLKYYEVNGLYPFFDNSKFTDQLYYNVEKQCYLQKIKQSNVITTQIKSTYATVEASVKTLQGVDVLAPDVILKVKNTEVQDKRDCTFKRSADGTQVYVYFEGGSQYTPGTSDVINTYYNSTTLPSFCEVGINVQLIGGVNGGFEVVGLLYESNLARYVMVVDAVLPDSVAVYGTCESTYNLEAWDILEFDTVFSTLEAGYYYIEVNATDPDPRYLPRTWRSEPIKVAADFKFDNVIKYFNTENINQIDYSTGITHELNVAGRFVNWSPKGDVTRFNGDEGSTFTLKSVKKRVITFESGYIPQYLAEKMVIAGAHDTVTINDIECRLIEDPEIVSNMDKNNPFYTVSMQMQLSEGIEITDSMGIVSESAAVLGATSTKVIGV